MAIYFDRIEVAITDIFGMAFDKEAGLDWVEASCFDEHVGEARSTIIFVFPGVVVTGPINRAGGGSLAWN